MENDKKDCPIIDVEGLITIDLDKPKNDPERIDFGGWDSETINNWNDGSAMTQEQAIDIVYDF